MKIVIAVMVLVLLGAVPVFADSIVSNIEHMDEVDLVYEIGGSDALYGSKSLDVGIMTGISNLGNPWNNAKTGSYVMIKADVKGIRLVNKLVDWIKNK